MRVVCVGDCGIDHYLPMDEKRVGGITANFARHARHEFPAEDEIEIVSCVGTDEDASLILSEMNIAGIDCHFSTQTGGTPVQTIEVEEDGEKNFVAYDEGVLREFLLDSGQREIIAAGDLVVAPVYLQIVDLLDDLLRIATAGKIAIDFADFLQHPDFTLLENVMDKVDIGFFGLTQKDTKTIDRIAMLAACHNKLFVVTLGAAGSVAFAGKDHFECSAMHVDRVVDTTGAGDAFAAGFLSRYCHGAGVDESLQHGAVLGARVVGSMGSWNTGD